MKTTVNEENSGLLKLYKESEIRAALGGISERKFKEMRAAGIVPAPLELGPRVARWTSADFDLILQRLRRRQKSLEPAMLAEGRRARAERTKAKNPAP
jgi:hypothetical protein